MKFLVENNVAYWPHLTLKNKCIRKCDHQFCKAIRFVTEQLIIIKKPIIKMINFKLYLIRIHYKS